MEMEQIFGQPSNYQEPLFSIFDTLLGLLILGLIVVFLLVPIGYLLDLKNNHPDTSDTIVIPAVTPTPNSTTEQISTIAQTNTIQTTTIQTATQSPTTTVQYPSSIKTTIPAATQYLSTTKKITNATATTQQAIYQALLKEFQYDLPRWKAEIDYTSLTIRFFHPDIFFKVGGSSLNQQSQAILADFFPRYVNLLKKQAPVIEAFSIEGHTSSEWQSSDSQDDAYFNNMALSQARTRAVLEYCLRLPSVKPYKDWLQSILTANGLASSRLIMENGFEKVEYSRRVEFRIQLIMRTI